MRMLTWSLSKDNIEECVFDASSRPGELSAQEYFASPSCRIVEEHVRKTVDRYVFRRWSPGGGKLQCRPEFLWLMKDWDATEAGGMPQKALYLKVTKTKVARRRVAKESDIP